MIKRDIVNAVHSLPQFSDVRCWNLVFNDVKSFLSKNGGRKEEAKVYKTTSKLYYGQKRNKTQIFYTHFYELVRSRVNSSAITT